MNRSRRARGRWGEDLAADHYRRAGFRILDRNWHSPEAERRGEIDLIARRDRLLVFCEVKTRRRGDHGGAASAVDHHKRAQVRSLAEIWLGAATIDLDATEIRFDVVAIDGNEVTIYPAAF